MKKCEQKVERKKGQTKQEKKHHKFVMASGPRNCSFVLKKNVCKFFLFLLAWINLLSEHQQTTNKLNKQECKINQL